MDDPGRFRWVVPEPVWRIPADLAATVGLATATLLAIFVPVVDETPVRIVLGLPFVLFLPGYAFIAALFPEAGEPPQEPETTDHTVELADVHHDRGIDGIERVALSFGLSIAITPLIGLILNFTPWGIRLAPIALSIYGFIVIATAVATHRRWELPAEERFHVPYRSWLSTARAELLEPDDRMDAGLNVLLVLSIVLALSSVGFAVLVPPEGERFTEFYLLTEDDDGELVADGYPEELTQGEPVELVVGVGNHEHEPVDYTVVVLMERVEIVGNETIVHEQHGIATYQTGTVAHNETWHHHHEVAAPVTGDNLRLTYLLYQETPPAELSAETAYRDLHVWVDVTAPEDPPDGDQ